MLLTQCTARNSDVWEIARSIRQVEDRFNRKYNYDWVFLNDADFDDTFKKVTTALTSGKAKYGKIDGEHWGFPDRKSTRLNSSHSGESRMPSSA